jgi:hypothetical protein
MPADTPAVALHDRAAENLRFIRSAMERAGSFTAVPGRGGIWIGATALAAAYVAGTPATSRWWLAVWLAEAGVAAAIGIVATARKARRSAVSLAAGPARRFALAYVPPLAAGGVLTVVFASNGLVERLPGMWLLLYGAAVAAGGAFSVRIVPAMGLGFMAAGVLSFVAPAVWGNLFMAGGFGGLHIAFGLAIAKRYGG